MEGTLGARSFQLRPDRAGGRGDRYRHLSGLNGIYCSRGCVEAFDSLRTTTQASFLLRRSLHNPKSTLPIFPIAAEYIVLGNYADKFAIVVTAHNRQQRPVIHGAERYVQRVIGM